MPKIESLYPLLHKISQEKNRPLKVICDWDEVVQNQLPLIAWKFSGEKTSFEEFYNQFWQAEFTTWKEFVNKYMSCKEDKDKFKILKEDTDFYNKSPFISITNDLLLALKNGSISELHFLSAYNSTEFAKGESDQRKNEIFEKTFGQFPQCKMKLIPFTPPKEHMAPKWDWVAKNHSDFDVFIDDQNDIVSKTIKKNPAPEKIYIMPSYGFNSCLQGNNVYHLNTNIVILREEDFVPQSPRETTPTNKLLKNLAELKSTTPEKKSIVLVIDGSFNPIHLGHVEMLRIARQEIEAKNPDVKVVGGYISPYSDMRIKKKLGDEAISITQRVEMINSAIEDSDWIEVDQWGQKYETSFPYESSGIGIIQIVGHLSDYLNSKINFGEIEVIGLCGNDVAEKFARYFGCPGANAGMIARGFKTIVVGRNENWRERVKNALDNGCGEGQWNDFIFFADGENNLEMSSTKVRKLIKEDNREELAKICDKKVIDYMKKNGLLKEEIIEAKIVENSRSRRRWSDKIKGKFPSISSIDFFKKK